ncbi:MAG: DUF2339 domain-containing protein [Gemmatimonadales bacterium]
MDLNNEQNLTARIERLELAVADISRRLDGRDARPAASAAFGSRASAPKSSASQQRKPATPVTPPRSMEWWLARGGALLTLFALVLLYQYAVSHNWITPLIRVAFGTAIGVALMVFANRIPRAPETTPDDTVGLREVLLGSSIAAWYITAYAAAIFYGLISFGAARLIFFGLSIAGCWLALKEKRALLALFALAVGFATPALLPSPSPSIPAFAIYVGMLGALGLILYLMRGWQSVLWLTFIAFWWSTVEATWIACCSLPGSSFTARVSMTILIVLAGAAMLRVPILRRRLLGAGSHLYTESRRSEAATSLLTELANVVTRFSGQPGGVDSPALWIITLSTPLIAIAQLALVWPGTPPLIWAAASLGAAAMAYRLVSARRASSEEFTHVEAAATALWSLAGALWLSSGVSDVFRVSSVAVGLLAASLHVVATLSLAKESSYVVPARLARITTGAIVSVVLLNEINQGRIAPHWTFAEVVGICVAFWVAWTYRLSGSKGYSAVLAAATYGALMLIDARVLGGIWRPLVTASYAIAGTALLMASKRFEPGEWIRRLGGITLVIVVFRLLMIDMAGVETIWRVLLFLGVGGLFLYTSHRMQRSGAATPAASPTPAGPSA